MVQEYGKRTSNFLAFYFHFSLVFYICGWWWGGGVSDKTVIPLVLVGYLSSHIKHGIME